MFQIRRISNQPDSVRNSMKIRVVSNKVKKLSNCSLSKFNRTHGHRTEETSSLLI